MTQNTKPEELTPSEKLKTLESELKLIPKEDTKRISSLKEDIQDIQMHILKYGNTWSLYE